MFWRAYFIPGHNGIVEGPYKLVGYMTKEVPGGSVIVGIMIQSDQTIREIMFSDMFTSDGRDFPLVFLKVDHAMDYLTLAKSLV